MNTRLAKAWTAIDMLSVIWKSDLSDKIKRNFFQVTIVSILLYGCTTWMLTKFIEKKLNGNCIKMRQAILNKSWKNHLTKQQLYDHQPPISKTIQIRRTRHAVHDWRSKDELITDVLLRILSQGRTSAGWPARTYLQQLCMDTRYSVKDLPGTMDDRERERERERKRERERERERECVCVCVCVFGKSVRAARHNHDHNIYIYTLPHGGWALWRRNCRPPLA